MVFCHAKQGNLLINLGHKLHTHSVCLERVSAHTDLHSQSIAQQKSQETGGTGSVSCHLQWPPDGMEGLEHSPLTRGFFLQLLPGPLLCACSQAWIERILKKMEKVAEFY